MSNTCVLFTSLSSMVPHLILPSTCTSCSQTGFWILQGEIPLDDIIEKCTNRFYIVGSEECHICTITCDIWFVDQTFVMLLLLDYHQTNHDSYPSAVSTMSTGTIRSTTSLTTTWRSLSRRRRKQNTTRGPRARSGSTIRWGITRCCSFETLPLSKVPRRPSKQPPHGPQVEDIATKYV